MSYLDNKDDYIHYLESLFLIQESIQENYLEKIKRLEKKIEMLQNGINLKLAA